MDECQFKDQCKGAFLQASSINASLKTRLETCFWPTMAGSIIHTLFTESQKLIRLFSGTDSPKTAPLLALLTDLPRLLCSEKVLLPSSVLTFVGRARSQQTGVGRLQIGFTMLVGNTHNHTHQTNLHKF